MPWQQPEGGQNVGEVVSTLWEWVDWFLKKGKTFSPSVDTRRPDSRLHVQAMSRIKQNWQYQNYASRGGAVLTLSLLQLMLSSKEKARVCVPAFFLTQSLQDVPKNRKDIVWMFENEHCHPHFRPTWNASLFGGRHKCELHLFWNLCRATWTCISGLSCCADGAQHRFLGRNRKRRRWCICSR